MADSSRDSGDGNGVYAGTPLSQDLRLDLGRLAWRAVVGWVCEQRVIAAPTGPSPLDEKRGVFVTLERNGALRGCIGYPYPVLPLGAAVIDCAISAASKDSRFEPVSAAELDELSIELSVLSVPYAIAAQAVEVGRHGLIVTAHGRRGLLLPQVATEHGWDRNTFLAQTCLKAGLTADTWLRKGTRIEAFEAEVFAAGRVGLDE